MNEKVIIKNPQEIESMRQSGMIAAEVLREVASAAKPGITTKELDEMAENLIRKHGAKPSFKGFNGFPASTCMSINDEVVHGLPYSRKLMDGDLLGIDLGAYYNGFHSDTALTVGIGKISEEAQRLIDITKLALDNAIQAIKPGIFLGDIQSLIQKTIEDQGFGVVRDLTGHGIGKSLHEAPAIPNFGKAGTGLVLQEGMTLAIEPMVSLKDWRVKSLDNGVIVTSDGSLAAHFEHTVALTKTGCQILTKN